MVATLTFDVGTGVVSSGDAAVRLQRVPAMIFEMLVRHAPHTVHSDVLSAALSLDNTSEAVKVAIARARKALKALKYASAIETVYGSGYRCTANVTILRAPTTVVIGGDSLNALRELLRRCSSRPADAELAERVRAALVN